MAKTVLLFWFQKATSLILQVHLYSAELFNAATWQFTQLVDVVLRDVV